MNPKPEAQSPTASPCLTLLLVSGEAADGFEQARRAVARASHPEDPAGAWVLGFL